MRIHNVMTGKQTQIDRGENDFGKKCILISDEDLFKIPDSSCVVLEKVSDIANLYEICKGEGY